MTKTVKTEYQVRFLLKHEYGIESIRIECGADLPKARSVQMALKKLLPKEKHCHLALMKTVTTNEYHSLGLSD